VGLVRLNTIDGTHIQYNHPVGCSKRCAYYFPVGIGIIPEPGLLYTGKRIRRMSGNLSRQGGGGTFTTQVTKKGLVERRARWKAK